MEIDQKRIAEYFIPVKSTNLESAENSQKWLDRIPNIEQWITEEGTIPKRVMRLRCHLRLHIQWISTASVWKYLLRTDSNFCEVPENSKWITCKKYMGSSGKLLEEYGQVLEEKK